MIIKDTFEYVYRKGFLRMLFMLYKVKLLRAAVKKSINIKIIEYSHGKCYYLIGEKAFICFYRLNYSLFLQ